MALSKSGQILLLCALAAPAAADSKCPSDKEINERIDSALALTDSYFGAVTKAASKWAKADCEVAKKDLIALEPTATKFYTTAKELMKWRDSFEESCRDKIKDAGQKNPKAATIEKKYSPLEATIKATFERCKDHEGFREAANKGLRVMKRKKPKAR